MVMASCVAVLFGDKIRSQSKPFLCLFQLVAAKDPVHEHPLVDGFSVLGQRLDVVLGYIFTIFICHIYTLNVAYATYWLWLETNLDRTLINWASYEVLFASSRALL